jgi:PIN domain nuclease of toxin-antitoxin system
VIILDTHVWVWWVHDDSRLDKSAREQIKSSESEGLGLSTISLWEVAKLSQLGRLTLPLPITNWFVQALSYPGIVLLELTPQIAIESTQLPGQFHRDPADQIIVATARILDCALITLDSKIKNYPDVATP